MSVRVQCIHCGATPQVNKRLIGRDIRCPVCDQTFHATSRAAEIQPSRESSHTAAKHHGSTKPNSPSPKSLDEFVEVVEIVEERVATPVGAGAADAKSQRPVTQSVGVDGEDEAEFEAGDFESDNDEDEYEDDVGEISFKKRELPKDDMDMTPMVDVTFLLLIFFMITASFSKEKVIEEPPPLSDKASLRREEPQKALDTVRIQVDEFNAYTIIFPGGEDRQASSKQDLLLALDEARKEMATGANNDALQMIVEAHTDSIHAAVVAALDAGRDKGFSSFTVKTVEEFD